MSFFPTSHFHPVFGELPEHPSWSHEGYRIDVSYIADNILVCSFPPTRSDVYELKRFMDDKHKVRTFCLFQYFGIFAFTITPYYVINADMQNQSNFFISGSL